MKKIVLTLITLMIPLCANALEDSTVLNLNTNKAYVIELDARPMDLQNSNPRAISVSSISDIMPEDSSIIIRTLEEGIAYVTFKVNDKPKTIKVLIDDKAEEDSNLLILDQYTEPKK